MAWTPPNNAVKQKSTWTPPENASIVNNTQQPQTTKQPNDVLFTKDVDNSQKVPFFGTNLVLPKSNVKKENTESKSFIDKYQDFAKKYFPKPLILSIAERVLPADESKTITQMKTPEKQKESNLTVEAQIQQNTDETVNIFKNFRNVVPSSELNQETAFQIDMSDVGLIPKTVKTQEGKEYTDLKFEPKKYEDLNELAIKFKNEYKAKFEEIENNYKRAEVNLQSKYGRYGDDSDVMTRLYHTKNDVQKLNIQKQEELKKLNEAYGELKEYLGNKVKTVKEADIQPFVSIDLENKDLKGIKETFKNSNQFYKSLLQQPEAFRKRNARDLTTDVELLGEDLEKHADKKEFDDRTDDLKLQLLTVPSVKKQSKEYYGTKLEINENERNLNSAVQQKIALQKQYNESKKRIDEVLKNVAEKGYTLKDLTEESRNGIFKAQEELSFFEETLKQADENINLRKQYSETLFSDISSYKDLIKYKAEKEKLRELYESNPYSTVLDEAGIYLTKGIVQNTGKFLEQTKTLYGKNDLDEKDKTEYLNKLQEYSEFKPQVEIEEDGVYVPLKDATFLQVFDKEGNFDPKVNAAPLLYQTTKFAGEMVYIAAPAGMLRKGALALGGNAIARELELRAAISATELGTTFGEKATIKGLQALEWTGRTTSLIPSSYVLFSPEMIDQELKKGLSISEIKTTTNLRILAEAVTENLLLDDVKFLDDLIKKGNIKTYKQLMDSDAYKILMDKLALKTTGKKLSELEYRALFNPKLLPKVVNKETLEAFARVTGNKLKPLGKGFYEGFSSQVEESVEEVGANFFNTLIDYYVASKHEGYEKGEPFTLENQINTFVQTMATMLPMGGMRALNSYKENNAERNYNMDLAAYQVAISPAIFQENLIEEYRKSQNTENPMSKEELTARLSELDVFGKIYESLGFSKEKEKESLEKEKESIIAEINKNPALKNKLPSLEREIDRQAQINLRQKEFETFRAALKKNEFENEFLNAKTDVEKEKLLAKIDEKIVEIDKLQEERKKAKEQVEKTREVEKEASKKVYDDTLNSLRQNVSNVESYLNLFTDRKEIEEQLEILDTLRQHSDKEIKNLSSSLYVELNNKLNGLEIIPEKELDPTEFTNTEKEFIEQLPIEQENVFKTETGEIIANINGEEVVFSSLKSMQESFLEKDEKIEKALKHQTAINDLEILNQEIQLPKNVNVDYNPTNEKFNVIFPGEPVIEFNTINEVKEYLANPIPKEDVQQTNLEKYNDEVDVLFEEYKANLKRGVPNKETWLNQSGTKKKLEKLRKKHGIEQPEVKEEKKDKQPIESIEIPTELTDEKINETNSIANELTLTSNGIQYLGYKLVNVPNLLAYLSRSYDEIQDENSTEIVENTNELNKEFNFLLSPNFNEGQEFTIVVKPVSDSNFIEKEKEELRNNTKYLLEQGISQEEINFDLGNDENFKEIQVFTKDGQYAGTIHSLSYIRPSRVVDYLFDDNGNPIPNLAPNYKQLKQLRETLIANEKDVTLKLTSKNSGHLSINRNENNEIENKPLTESFKNKEVLDTIQVTSKTSTLRYKGKESINEANSGATVVSIITPNNKVFALSLQKRTLKPLEVSTIVDSISLHVEYQKLLRSESTPEIQKSIEYIENFATSVSDEYNILTPEGLKQYIQLFVHANSKTSDFINRAKREGTENIPFIDVDTTDRGDFRITFSNSRTFQDELFEEGTEEKSDISVETGIYRFTLSDLNNKQTLNQFSNLFKEHLGNRRINHSTSLSNTTSKFRIPFIKATRSKNTPFIKVEETELEENGLSSQYKSYKDFLIETSLTPIIETELPDKTYSYFQQPNIELTPTISKQQEQTIVEEEIKPIAPPEVVAQQDIEAKKADIERRRREVKAAIQKAGQGEGGQFIVTLLDGTKENAVRISLVGNELGIGNKGVTVDLSIIKKVENPNGIVLYDAEKQSTSTTQTESNPVLSDVESTAKQKLDPDLANIDPIIIAARNGDKEAQRKLDEYGLDWEQTTTYRFVGQPEVNVLLSDKKVESKRFSDAGIDVTTSPKVTSAANAEYRVTFKESFDVNNGLGKVKGKSKEEGDHNLEKGRGYTLNDVAKIERLDENGNVVEVIYDSESLLSKEQPTPTTQSEIKDKKEELIKQIKDAEEDLEMFSTLVDSFKENSPEWNNATFGYTTRELNLKDLKKQLENLEEQPKLEKEKQIIPTTEQQLIEKSKELTETDVTSLDDIIDSLDEDLKNLLDDDVPFQLPSSEGQIASEKTIRDLAARMSDRIGMPIKFESDRSKEYKGKIENNIAYVNLAYATLDTPIHEILGHPIIRAIKNKNLQKPQIITDVDSFFTLDGSEYVFEKNTNEYFKDGKEISKRDFDNAVKKVEQLNSQVSQLYQNLLKELETGKGKEVSDRIKRDYVNKQRTYEYSNYGDGSIIETTKNTKIVESSKEEFELAKLKGNFVDSYRDDFIDSNSVTYELNGDRYIYHYGSDTVEKYTKNEIPKYTLEEQQEEAIVELLGLMTAEKLDKVKDGKLISLLKRLLKEMKQFVRSLLNLKEVEIDKLPDNMTINDLADLLAYSNSKLILPGYEVEYTTPDNMKFKTYQEASNHIGQLAKSVEDVDLDKNISVDNIDKEIETLQKELDNFKFEIEPFNKFTDVYTKKGRLRQNYWARKKDGTTGWTGGAKETLIEPEYDGFVLDTDRGDGRFITKISDEEAEKLYYAEENKFNTTTKASREKYAELETKIHNLKNNSLKGFIEKNKEYEQSKEIIEEWKKVNNIQYNPEEIYSRGQEFSSVVGAYSSFDVNLMMQNLLQHIEDNEKAGGKFAISAYTKPIDKTIGHLEGGGGKIKFKLYPQSNDILWAANTDVYSGSVWDASEKVNKDKKSELLGVSYTKYPSLNNVNAVQPNLASVVDNLAHHHNELGIVLTGNNFRLEYDEDIPYQTKKIIDSINKILDQKYGKLVKPDLSKKILKSEKVYEVRWKNNRGVIIRTTDINKAKAKMQGNYTDAQGNKLNTEDVVELAEGNPIEQVGIQPTQTKDNLKESINSIKNTQLQRKTAYSVKEGNILRSEGWKSVGFNQELEEEYFEKPDTKEYTSQALINTKIAALKEVAKKYPRSLIRGEVKKINTSSSSELYDQFGKDELPFQKIPNNTEKNVTFVTKEDLDKLDKKEPC